MKKMKSKKKSDDRLERVLSEMGGQLECWECWHGDEEPYTQCTCQTCQFRVSLDNMVDIANGCS